MLRHPPHSPRLVDVAAAAAAELAARAGVQLDEVQLVDDDDAASWRAGGRAVVGLPVRYLTGATLNPAGRATLAHELGHQLQHFTVEHDRSRHSPKLLAVAVAAVSLVASVAVAVVSGRHLICLLGVLGTWAVVLPAGWWIGDAGARRGEYAADQYAARAVGRDAVDEQLRALQNLERSRSLRRPRVLLRTSHPPIARRRARLPRQ